MLGYDVAPGGGRLIVNEPEAEQVRAIFAYFEQHRSAQLTLAEIDRRGWHLKSWTPKSGQFRAGSAFDRNSLRRLLSNGLYTGAVHHQGQPYPGEHAAILAPGTWERVQALMTQRAAWAQGRIRNKHRSLLTGLLFCESCAVPMVYSYAQKGDRRYPYYLCQNAQRNGWAVCPTRSIAVHAIEQAVLRRIRDVQHGIFDSGEWDRMDRTRQLEAIHAVVERVGYDGVARKISLRFPAARGEAVSNEVRL